MEASRVHFLLRMGKEVSRLKIHVLMPDDGVREGFLPPANRKLLESVGETRWNTSRGQMAGEELKDALRSADVLVTGWGCPRVTADLLGDGKHASLLVHTGGTVAPFVDSGAMGGGLRVVSANELYAKSVAEGTAAYILAALRNIPYWDREVRAGRWRGNAFENRGLFGKKVGLTGFGAVARHLLPLLKAFDTEIMVCSGHLSPEKCEAAGMKKAGLEEIFSTCDVVSIHNSLTEATRHLIGGSLLSLLKPGAVLVNTSRGAVIDQQALTEELKKGRFTALLDVFETEPLEVGSPLRALNNVILVPHMAGPTSDLYETIGREMIREIRNYRDGKPLRYEISVSEVGHMTAKG